MKKALPFVAAFALLVGLVASGDSFQSSFPSSGGNSSAISSVVSNPPLSGAGTSADHLLMTPGSATTAGYVIADGGSQVVNASWDVLRDISLTASKSFRFDGPGSNPQMFYYQPSSILQFANITTISTTNTLEASRIQSNIASTGVAFLSLTGARWDHGGGANDYMVSDGTNISTPSAFTASNITGTNTGDQAVTAANGLTSGPIAMALAGAAQAGTIAGTSAAQTLAPTLTLSEPLTVTGGTITSAKNHNGTTGYVLTNTSSGASAYSQYFLSVGGASGEVSMSSSGVGTSGAMKGSQMQIGAGGANGVALYTSASVPIVIAPNYTAALSFTGAGVATFAKRVTFSGNRGSATVDFADIASGNCADSSNITVTDAADGDACAVGGVNATASTAGSQFSCYTSGAGTVKARHCCVGPSNCDPGSATFIVNVFP